MIPQSYAEWKSCIVNDCRIPLTPAFIQQRLSVYQDRQDNETKQFVSLYGEQHLENIINWLLIAQETPSQS